MDLDGWLSHLESIHPIEIDLSLDRIQCVFDKMALNFGGSIIILVSGTNGKGTTIRAMEQLLHAQGISTGVYSSPHIQCYTERVRLNGNNPSPQTFIDSFEWVEQMRDDATLTYFEFGTLSAFKLFADASPEVLLIEVGLGGRFDATNIISPDVSILTSVSLDHERWFGTDLSAIGYEKAGIARLNRPFIIGQPDAPERVREAAAEIGASVYWAGEDFLIQHDNTTVTLGIGGELYQVPNVSFHPHNVACAMLALKQIGYLPSPAQLASMDISFSLLGRLQILSTQPMILMDVGHNEDAARFLNKKIKLHYPDKKISAVCGMMKDKAIQKTLAHLNLTISNWYFAPLQTERSATTQQLLDALTLSSKENEQISDATCIDKACFEVNCFDTLAEACETAVESLRDSDVLLIFGSFFTVSEAMTWWQGSET